jgi:Bacteriophage Lambda NinG protein
MLMAVKPKLKKCCECRQKFQPRNSFDKVCDNIECKVSYGTKVAEKSRISREKKQKQQAIKQRAEDKEKLSRLTPGYLAGKAQDAVNEYVRFRDYDKPCISCGKHAHSTMDWDAGHLKTRGANSFLRYHLWNINKQCVRCNQHNSGNVAEHERGIVARYGQSRLDFLQSAPRMRRYADDYLIRLTAVFRKKTRMLKKRLGLS